MLRRDAALDAIQQGGPAVHDCGERGFAARQYEIGRRYHVPPLGLHRGADRAIQVRANKGHRPIVSSNTLAVRISRRGGRSRTCHRYVAPWA
jgi:hypothetical protein